MFEQRLLVVELTAAVGALVVQILFGKYRVHFELAV
jgi:hypothetical protein